MIYGFNAGEVFKIGIEIEENGRQFYEKAQAKTDNDKVKGIFAELAGEEVKHKQRFSELMSELPESTQSGTVWDPDNEMDQYLKMMADMHVFRKKESVDQRLAEVSDAESALKMAIQFEKDSIVFFAEMQSMSESDEARSKIGWLVREEQKHLKKLSKELLELRR
jgi:rubrerythrin